MRPDLTSLSKRGVINLDSKPMSHWFSHSHASRHGYAALAEDSID